ncbi:RDH13 family protein [Megaselia abdita]
MDLSVIAYTSLSLVVLYWFRKFLKGPMFKKPIRIDGKVVVITGCNTGIGKETALDLAKRGGKIYMACRDYEKCEAARIEIIGKSGNQNVFNRTLDLSSLRSVRAFCHQFLQEEERLDILINNAGVLGDSKVRQLTEDGFEMHFGVNHLGHFLLTNLLLDAIKKAAPSRIVVVTSLMYAAARIDKDDINLEKSYKGMDAYSKSKLANLLFTKELASRLEGSGVTVNCCHPGIVKTDISRNVLTGEESNFQKGLMNVCTKLFFKTAKSGAQPSIRLALEPSLEGKSGGYYFDACQAPVMKKAKDPKMMKWLWGVSEELVGLK